MKRAIVAAVAALVCAGCAGNTETTQTSEAAEHADHPSSASTTAAASECTGSGLDAMPALSDFELEMDAAQKNGKITLDQLLASRNKLYEQTQAASGKQDWTAYCKAIDDMRAELGL